MVKTFRLSLRLWNQACNLQLPFLLRYGTAVSQESLSLDCPLGEGILVIMVICVSCSGMLHCASFVNPLMKNEFSSGCSLRLSCQLLKQLQPLMHFAQTTCQSSQRYTHHLYHFYFPFSDFDNFFFWYYYLSRDVCNLSPLWFFSTLLQKRIIYGDDV